MIRLFRKKDAVRKLSWSDLTIAKFKKVKAILDTTDEDDLVWALIGICYDMTEEQVNNLPIRVAEDYARGVSFLNTEPKKRTAKRSYELNGKRYITTMDFTRISTAQFIDFQQAWRECEEHPERVLAIILIPEGHRYNDGYSTQEVIEDIENYMTIPDSLGLCAFFFNLLRWSMRVTARKMKRLLRRAEKEGKMSQEQLQMLRNIIQMANSADGLNA